LEKATLAIKNMVCSRCIKVVKEELENLNLEVEAIKLGEAVVKGKVINLQKIKETLEKNGFELLDDRHSKIIEQIKISVIKVIYEGDENLLSTINFPVYLSQKLNLSYHYISTLFSSKEGITIEKYIINQKIERVKELLVYDEFSLSEISYRLGYSSVQHLSNQFKKVTGLTPSHFKSLKEKKRRTLDNI
jgi:AraC family transcriptional regulator